jgi:O-methyltransferase domain/Dimerisation domain
MTTENGTSPVSLIQIATGFWTSRALYVVAKLGIADRLEEGAEAAEALASACGVHAGSLLRVMRALASLGIFSETAEGLFQQTPLSRGLRSDATGSLREFVVMLGEPESWLAWGDVMHSIRTGESAFEHVFGVPQFDYLATHPEAARNFDAAMVERGIAENEAVLAAWDFPQSGLVVDVGGGLGTLLAAVMRCRQGLNGTLFDVPHVVERALPLFEAQGLARRYQSVAGDFFTDPLPAGADLYLLKKVIHDWDDTQAVEILQACARAMSPTSRLLLIEPVIAPGNDPSFAKMLDLFMLVWPGGRERTMPEHERIIAAAGLVLRRSLVTRSPLSILEVVRPT